jgi:hypothetical protein
MSGIYRLIALEIGIVPANPTGQAVYVNFHCWMQRFVQAPEQRFLGPRPIRVSALEPCTDDLSW